MFTVLNEDVHSFNPIQAKRMVHAGLRPHDVHDMLGSHHKSLAFQVSTGFVRFLYRNWTLNFT